MDQTLSYYRIFYAVASTGNVSKAAKELYISQPAISKSIQKLSIMMVKWNKNRRINIWE